jgi:hypothetical protein
MVTIHIINSSTGSGSEIEAVNGLARETFGEGITGVSVNQAGVFIHFVQMPTTAEFNQIAQLFGDEMEIIEEENEQ